MIHPSTEVRYISAAVGYGVVATAKIPAGTLVWVQDKLDREFTVEQVQAMGPAYQDILDRYSFRNREGRYVFCWDHARFVNHSFRSNCLSTAYHFEIAIRDIAEGEELTDDYGYLNIIEPFKAADEGTRRKWVYPDDLLRMHAVWDRRLQKAFRKIPSVNQPLWSLLVASTQQHCQRVARGEDAMASILDLYCPDK